ncbi:MAG: single-stranded-DNA-specific exonuclease RecJ [Candidatus Paceibacterota bacterium]
MKNWKIKEDVPEDVVNELLSYPTLTKHLLYHRGIKTGRDAEKFLNPQYADLHDPFLILNMDRAVDRVLAAIKNNERVTVYADYDCDGIPGAVVLHDFFTKIGYTNFSVYIPHRYKEGYGLNIPAVEQIASEGTKLLITVDTGITDVAQVDRANELGMDVIITDHHLTQEKVPAAYTILNSKQAEDKYPYNMLCGAAVAFKLVQALIKKGGFDIGDGWEKWLLDAVGISTIADMVPLDGENRVLATCGLKVLRKTRRPGLVSLFYKTRVNQPDLAEDDIGFTVAPHINAASRMGEPLMGFRFLSTSDPAEAETLATYLGSKNTERKSAVSWIISEAEEAVKLTPADSRVVVVGNDKWLPGVVGLAAAKISEKYKKVAFVWGREGTSMIRGSCRSDGFINMVSLMEAVGKDFFSDFGGHALAGGFSVVEDKIHKLQDKLNEVYQNLTGGCGPDDNQDISIDAKLMLDDVNWKTYSQIEKLAPYGTGNPKPLFLLEGVSAFNTRWFGADGNHVALDFRKGDGSIISALAFGAANAGFEEGVFSPNCLVDMVVTLEKSYFKNRPELRMRIIDIKKSF